MTVTEPFASFEQLPTVQQSAASGPAAHSEHHQQCDKGYGSVRGTELCLHNTQCLVAVEHSERFCSCRTGNRRRRHSDREDSNCFCAAVFRALRFFPQYKGVGADSDLTEDVPHPSSGARDRQASLCKTNEHAERHISCRRANYAIRAKYNLPAGPLSFHCLSRISDLRKQPVSLILREHASGHACHNKRTRAHCFWSL